MNKNILNEVNEIRKMMGLINEELSPEVLDILGGKKGITVKNANRTSPDFFGKRVDYRLEIIGNPYFGNNQVVVIPVKDMEGKEGKIMTICGNPLTYKYDLILGDSAIFEIEPNTNDGFQVLDDLRKLACNAFAKNDNGDSSNIA